MSKSGNIFLLYFASKKMSRQFIFINYVKLAITIETIIIILHINFD